MIPSGIRLRIETVLICIVVVLPLPAQTVTDVRFEMTRNQVVILYDLVAEDDSSKYYISVYPSVDGGRVFGQKLKEIEGDLKNVEEGKDKAIYWNFKKEYLEKDGDVTLELRAVKAMEIDYCGEKMDITEVKPSITGQPITNIRFTKNNNRIVFLYDLDCTNDSSEFFISVNPSLNGGKTFREKLRAIEGDFNRVKCGKDKAIVWRVADEKDFLSKSGEYGQIVDSTSGWLGAFAGVLTSMAAEDEVKKIQGRREILFALKAEGTRTIANGDTLVLVDDMPSFPGGFEEMFRFIFENIKYPAEAKKQGIQGRVIVTFVITTEGKVDKVKIFKGVHPLLDAEAVRVVSIMPDWSPGLMGDTPVNVRFSIPVSFNIR